MYTPVNEKKSKGKSEQVKGESKFLLIKRA